MNTKAGTKENRDTIFLAHTTLWISVLFALACFPHSESFSSPLTSLSYQSHVLKFFDEEQISWKAANLPDHFESGSSEFIDFENSPILLHLIPTPSSLSQSLPPNFNKRLTDWISFTNYTKVIHLHQDVWLTKNEIAKSRLLVQLGGAGRRIFARKTVFQRINATFAMSFLDQHHLWGATRAKYYYGLFLENELVSVATFSARRKVQRNKRLFRSHELLRYCSQRKSTVVGGISKLCKNFIRDIQPDDIVTVVDRDWGDGSGWHSLGFETVAVMDPLVMIVNPTEPGVRRHLIGAGISTSVARNNESIKIGKMARAPRLGLEMEMFKKLASIENPKEAMSLLAQDQFYPVYDTGVERLLKVVSHQNEEETTKVLWRHSVPKYASNYYSNNSGIASLLAHAASGGAPLDSSESTDALESWRKTSGTAASAQIIFSAPSSMDPTAVVEVRERARGWRTVGIVGSAKNPSIYHSVYKVNKTGQVEPTAIASEFIKTMAVLSLAGQSNLTCNKAPRFLHFGYGAGTLVRLLAHHVVDSQHEVVELDSGVVQASNKLLPSLLNVSIQVLDALDYARQTKLDEEDRFDCICVDVFDETLKVPEEFYSEDFLKRLSENLLKPAGIMVQNFHSGGKRRRQVLEKATAATNLVFGEFCWVDTLDSKPNAGNKILMASKVLLCEENKDIGIEKVLTRNALMVQSKYGLNFDAPARVKGAKKTC